MDPLQIRNPFTDQNQTQHNSLRSGELLIGQNSSSADQRGPAHKGSTYKVSVSFFFLFLDFFILFVSWLSAQQKRLGRFWRSIRQKTRSRARKCLLGVPTLPKSSKGFIFPKNPKLGPGIGICSLYKTINNFSTVHAIFAQISSIDAAWRKTY